MKREQKIGLALIIFLLVLSQPVAAQLSNLLIDGSDAYATIRKVNHEIEWAFVILCGAVLMACFRCLSWLRPSMMVPAMQRALAGLIYLVIAFCIMLVMIQFMDFWMPVASLAFDYVLELF